MVDNYTRLNWLDPKFGESVLSGASQAFAAWTQTVWDPAVFSAWNLSFSKDRWEVESLEEKWQHVYASGLETAQAVTLFFNMFFLFDVSCHWGGMGGGCLHSMHLHTCLMLCKYIVFGRCQRSLNVCTPAVYGIRVVFDTFLCSRTGTCVAHGCACFSGDVTRLDLAHMFDVT